MKNQIFSRDPCCSQTFFSSNAAFSQKLRVTNNVCPNNWLVQSCILAVTGSQTGNHNLSLPQSDCCKGVVSDLPEIYTATNAMKEILDTRAAKCFTSLHCDIKCWSLSLPVSSSETKCTTTALNVSDSWQPKPFKHSTQHPVLGAQLRQLQLPLQHEKRKKQCETDACNKQMQML